MYLKNFSQCVSILRGIGLRNDNLDVALHGVGGLHDTVHRIGERRQRLVQRHMLCIAAGAAHMPVKKLRLLLKAYISPKKRP